MKLTILVKTADTCYAMNKTHNNTCNNVIPLHNTDMRLGHISP